MSAFYYLYLYMDLNQSPPILYCATHHRRLREITGSLTLTVQTKGELAKSRCDGVIRVPR